ncbi:Ran-specific GTPase-activating protein 1 (Chromosome stability protein 20) (Perinuclear array-localized protein) (Ran-binding protein 1) (RANBP1), partial [Durusdinium trenchii]
TLEEDEEVCFKKRCKLFLFVEKDVYGGEERTNFWKERGTGEVKLLKHKEFGKVRVLMRQEKTLKICANHLVSPHVVLAPNVGSDRSWVFSAADFADEELKTETFAIKFGSAEFANLFKEKMEMAKKINADEMSPDELKPVADDDEDQEKAVIDKQIEERNKREEQRRDSVRAQSAVEDSDHDSQAEDVNEGGADRIKQTVGDPAANELADGMSKVALCGGYSEAAPDSEEVAAAAAFAVAELGKGELVKVAEAAQQVVAGMNYRIVLHIKHADDGATHSYLAVVFKPLPHENKPMSLTESTHHGVVA